MKTTLTILKNSSKLSNEKVKDFFKTREPGYHLGLAQDRYGDGAFMMDWKECGETKPTVTPDWNILVHVSYNQTTPRVSIELARENGLY